MDRLSTVSPTEHSPVGVLVSSCDAFQDLWAPFFALFFRYWPDCPYPVYLITNEAHHPDARVESLAVGPDRHWATNCRLALDRIAEPWVLYLQEDYFLERPVSTPRVRSLIDYAIEHRAGYLRLHPCPGPDAPLAEHPEFGVLLPGADTRASLQAALWRKDTLRTLLVEGETGWEMELRGSRRSDALDDPFWSVRLDPRTGRNTDPPLPYCRIVVVHGMWTRAGLRLCRSERVPVDLRVRQVYPLWRDLWDHAGVRRSYWEMRYVAGLILRRLGLLGRRPR